MKRQTRRRHFIRLERATSHLAKGSAHREMDRKYGLKTVVISALICTLPFIPSVSAGQSENTSPENQVLAIGTAPIPGHNRALAKKRAISEALSGGVQGYMVRRLSHRDLINNFERITRDFIPVARDAIDNFNILAEETSKDTYTVLVRIKVNEGLIADKLRQAGIVITRGVNLRILLLVSEITESGTDYWWKDPGAYPALTATEVALYKAFQDRGWDPINRTQNTPQIESDSEMTASDLSTEALMKWGTLFDADIVVYGQCRMKDQKEVTLSLNAVDLDGGMSMCQEFGMEPMDQGPPPSNENHAAIHRLARALVAQVSSCIMKEVSEKQGKVHELKITLDGVNSYTQFITLSAFLEQKVQGVESVIPSRIKQDAVSALVTFQGDKKLFITRVLNHPERPFPVHVSQDMGGVIRFSIE